MKTAHTLGMTFAVSMLAFGPASADLMGVAIDGEWTSDATWFNVTTGMAGHEPNKPWPPAT